MIAPHGRSGLIINGLSVRFGGLTAVDQVSLHAPAGSITGLIGPNGAGKTTTFNACTGVVSTRQGSVELEGITLDGMSPAARAHRGLGRTFQRMELFDNMTVAENVALGPEALLSARRPWGQLFCTRRDRETIREAAHSALERCGIAMLSNRIAGDLSTGQRRLVELARAIASPFRFLLLDEPSSGLDVMETERFGAILSKFVADSGMGILLVEHDMHLVARVCEFIYVLDFGQLIHSGPCAETLNSDVVKAAYLGAESVDLENEGTARA
jgi:ABC-type branched-subunit amino acid transport system ATPase component